MEEYTDLIKLYLLIHGHSLDYKIANIDEEMANYIVSLSELEYQKEKVRTPYIMRRTVLKQGKEFYNTFFKVHDILYATPKIVSSLQDEDIYDYTQALELYNGLGRKINPFTLPVSFTSKGEKDGYLKMLCVDIEDEEFLQKMHPYFSKICLNRFPTIITPSSYIHELCHLELESNKCSITDYNNSELFPIFLEFISLLENNKILRHNLINRIEFLITELDRLISFYYEKEKNINIYQAFISSKYIISIIKALNLLLIYINSSSKVKKEILESIQKVFDKNRTTEEIISSYDITLESSLDINIIKQLLRR